MLAVSGQLHIPATLLHENELMESINYACAPHSQSARRGEEKLCPWQKLNPNSQLFSPNHNYQITKQTSSVRYHNMGTGELNIQSGLCREAKYLSSC